MKILAAVLDSNLVAAIAGALIGALLAVVAEPLRRYFFGPRLNVKYTGGEDCRAVSPTTNGLTAIYIRAKVVNTGRAVARACRVFLVQVDVADDKGVYQPTHFADGLQLAWSCKADRERFTPLDLPKGVPQYVDVVSTLQNHPGYSLYLAQRLYRYNSIFVGVPKRFRFKLVVAGDGVSPAELSLLIDISPQWEKVWAGTA